MKLEDQVVSLELAKKLAELDLKQQSMFWWCKNDDGDWHVVFTSTLPHDLAREAIGDYEFYSAFSVAELGEMLPAGFNAVKLPNGWEVCFVQNKIQKWRIDEQETKTEADARAKLVIYLIENKLITL